MFYFQNQEFLYLLLLVPLFFLLFFYRQNHSKKTLLKIFQTRTLHSLVGKGWGRKRLLRHLIFQGFFVFLILALAQPVGENRLEERTLKGLEMMILADVSNSMLAKDLGGQGAHALSRLDVMKKELKKMVSLLPNHQMGLVAFAGEARLISPMTTDPNILHTYIDTLNPIDFRQGTDFANALAVGMQALNRGGVVNPDNPVNKVILIASDGGDHEAGALALAHALKKQGVTILSLGFGTKEGAPIPKPSQKRQAKSGYQKDSDGHVVIATFEEEALTRLAKGGGGAFYHFNFVKNTAQNIVSDIQSLPLNRTAKIKLQLASQLYPFFLSAAFLLGLAYLLISELSRPFHRQPPWQKIE